METHKNMIVDKVFSHIGAFLLLAAGGFSIWGTIEQQMQTAWGASKEGCIAVAVAAYLLGVASGIKLVRHFELSKATAELAELRDSLTSAEKEVKAAQAQLAGKDAAIKREKEKSAKVASNLNQRISELEGENAELTARLEELNSEERRIRKEIVHMSEYEKAQIRGMYLRPGGRELAIDHVENPEAMSFARKGITELSEVHVEDDGYRFVHEYLTLAAHDVIRTHPELVGIDGSDMSVVTELTAKLDEERKGRLHNTAQDMELAKSNEDSAVLAEEVAE